MTDLTVVPFKREQKLDPIAALTEIIRSMESGEVSGVEAGVLIMASAEGEIYTFDFGGCDPLRIIGMLRLAETMTVESCLGMEE